MNKRQIAKNYFFTSSSAPLYDLHLCRARTFLTIFVLNEICVLQALFYSADQSMTHFFKDLLCTSKRILFRLLQIFSVYVSRKTADCRLQSFGRILWVQVTNSLFQRQRKLSVLSLEDARNGLNFCAEVSAYEISCFQVPVKYSVRYRSDCSGKRFVRLGASSKMVMNYTIFHIRAEK